MKRKLAWLLTFIMVLSVAFLGGCGNKKEEITAESLVTQASENMEKVKSFAGDMDLELSMNMSSEGISMGIDMSMIGPFEAIMEPEIFHMNPTLQMSLLGLSMDMDMYSVTEDGVATTYSGMAGEWTKAETAASDDSGMNFENMYTLAEDGTDMTLAEGTEIFNDQNVYVLTATISGSELASVLGSVDTLTEGLGELDFSETEATVTYMIYEETRLPASISLELIISGEGAESDGVLIKIESMSIVMNFTDFNNIDSIEIPQEALNA